MDFDWDLPEEKPKKAYPNAIAPRIIGPDEKNSNIQWLSMMENHHFANMQIRYPLDFDSHEASVYFSLN